LPEVSCVFFECLRWNFGTRRHDVWWDGVPPVADDIRGRGVLAAAQVTTIGAGQEPWPIPGPPYGSVSRNQMFLCRDNPENSTFAWLPDQDRSHLPTGRRDTLALRRLHGNVVSQSPGKDTLAMLNPEIAVRVRELDCLGLSVVFFLQPRFDVNVG